MSIEPESRVTSVSLIVSNLDRSLGFYRSIGFEAAPTGANHAALGAPGGKPFLYLEAHAGAIHPHGVTGLFHFAVLHPDRAALARAFRHMVAARIRFTGFADHLVSEALYFSDPDGNGIEYYRDRPRGQWTRHGVEVKMTTDPLDLDSLLEEAANAPDAWLGLEAGTRLGHMHLHVAHIRPAEQFYRDTLGFDLTARFGSQASFYAAGGYHHHIATNTWAGVGAPPPPEGSVGLNEFTIEVPNEAAVRNVALRLATQGVAYREDGPDLLTEDPSRNRVRISPAA
jgi:catechol 2,3-dioxygenase